MDKFERNQVTEVLAGAIDPPSFPQNLFALRLSNKACSRLIARQSVALRAAEAALDRVVRDGWHFALMLSPSGEPIGAAGPVDEALIGALAQGIADALTLSGGRHLRRCAHRARIGCAALQAKGWTVLRSTG